MSSKRTLCVIVVVTLCLGTLGTAALIWGHNQDETDGPMIRLKAAAFDPLKEQPTLPQALTLDEPSGYYLVQCGGPIQSQWFNTLTNMGAVIEGYIPDYAYVAQMDEETASHIDKLAFVRWTGLYHPAYRLGSELLDKSGEIVLNVLVFKGAGGEKNLLTAVESIEILGGMIQHKGSWEIGEYLLRVVIDAARIVEVAHIPKVMWIDEWTPPQPCMNNVRDYIGIDYAHLNHGFDGTGILGEVKDCGLDVNHPELVGRPDYSQGYFDSSAAHGTCCFGIVFASGVNAQARGILPNAGTAYCYMGVDRLVSIFSLSNWGGVFQSNSWRQGDFTAEYSGNSYHDDLSVFLYDISMVYAGGNEGDDVMNLAQDAVAKNVIGVGGLAHWDTPDRDDDSWDCGPYIVEASYGPAADGRIKPDVCGPYEDIYTVDALGMEGYRQGDYVVKASDHKFGDTSAGTAIVAGCIGIIYQMFIENFFGNNGQGETPHAATVKAILIADAYQYDFTQATRYQQGWGTPDIQNIIDIGEGHFIVDEETPLETGQSVTYTVRPDTADPRPLKITLVWTDAPAMAGANPALVNDLDLKVTAPDATEYWGNYGLETSHWSVAGGYSDSLNNVENVFIEAPMAGDWTIEVIAVNVAQDGHPETGGVIDQDFALVATHSTGFICGDIDNSGADPDIGDLVYLVDYMFNGGPEPPVMQAANVDGSGGIDISDLVYLVDYMFNGGPAPVCGG